MTFATAVAFAVLAALAAAGSASAANLFSPAPGELSVARDTAAAARLGSGKVLVAGGFDAGTALASAEIYDPATGATEGLAAEEAVAHGEQATVALPDGRVLIIGGWSLPTGALATGEVFDPASRAFTALSSEMGVKRDGPAAVLLGSGKVFITGGGGAGPYTKTAEIFDPATETFTAVKGTALQGRYEPTAVLLPNGKVLIAGGYSGPPEEEARKTAEVFDPSSETFEKLEGAGHEPAERRESAGAVTLRNGRVIIAGGSNGEGEVATAEAFDPATATFSALPDTLTVERGGVSAVTLADGRGLFVGGVHHSTVTLKSIDITTLQAPLATTGAASNVGTTHATLNGTVSTEATATTRFQFGTSTAYGSATPAAAIGSAPAAQGVAASVSGLSPGTTYHFRIVAENAGGTSYGADQSFTTAGGPLNGQPPVPTLGSVKQSHTKWREGSALALASRKRVPLGTLFTFTLNTPAKVTFTFTQRVAGRKVHGSCVAPSHRNRSASSCKRTLTRGALSINAHAGRNKLAFQGRVSHSVKLAVGTYTVVIGATGPSGKAKPQRLTFTIVG
jgi:hypothetical protein